MTWGQAMLTAVDACDKGAACLTRVLLKSALSVLSLVACCKLLAATHAFCCAAECPVHFTGRGRSVSMPSNGASLQSRWLCGLPVCLRYFFVGAARGVHGSALLMLLL